ncbi:MAG: efflux RND transporter periplasmic adaptor subunit [Paludibacteraceae bacterium]|nr:efflux RND transporter periplasmic adaptor subunit [Paludibacteraceae bacterium]MBO7606096.1 efflux RND transporter periplasmic adaptor subunit [Paludibacteraceae bacterium]
MKKVVRWGWVSVMALALVGLTAGCGKSDKKKADESTESEGPKVEKVRVEPVVKQEIERDVECTAVLEGYETMNVSPSLTGIIEKRFKDVGDHVSTGDLLVRMDQNQLIQAKLNLANLETEMKRMDALLAGGNVTQQTYDKTKMGYEQAKQQVEFLQNNTFFKATFPGVVSARNYESGELFNGARPILTVVQLNMLKAIIDVPEAYFPKIKAGMKLNIISDIYPDTKFPAVIETIYPTIDAATHTFQCKVKIPNGSMKLRPGMYVHTAVNVGKVKVLAVPYQSVLKLTGSNERYLFLNENGFAKRVTVEAGQRFNRYVEVISDEVVEGGEVVTQGQARLIDGVELQIIDGDYQEKIEADTLISDAKEAEVKTEKK